MLVYVRNQDVQKALKQLNKKLQRDGRAWEIARKASYMKPSAQRRTDHRRAVRRARKEAARGAQ